MKLFLFVCLLTVFIAPTNTYADVSLLIHEATGYSGEMTGAGHVTVYLSNVCTDAPLVLRLCRDDEPKGVVVASYPAFSKQNTDYRWFAMPVLPYIYGVDSEKEIPLYANGKVRTLLREKNRAEYLSKIIPRDELATEQPSGRWSGVIGAALNRDLYALTVKTTAEQDAKFLEKYNISPKGNDFNIMFKNCADFTRKVMNFYFPGSASRDFINDFGMTTPKALARSFNGYAAARPNLMFHITKYPQLDGTILRSFGNRNFTETAFTSRKYYITQLLTMPTLLPMFAGTYYLTAHFNINSAYKVNPSSEAARLNLQEYRRRQVGSKENKEALADIKAAKKAEQQRIFGEKSAWEKYRRELAPMLEDAIKKGLFADKKEIETFYGDLERQSEPFFDERGELMLKVDNYGEKVDLGLTRGNILGADSDAALAYKLMLVKMNYQLNAPAANRESWEVIEANRLILTELSKRSADLRLPETASGARFLTKPETKSPKTKMLQLFRVVTH